MKSKIAVAGCSALILGGYLFLLYRISELRERVRRMDAGKSDLYNEDDDEDDEDDKF